MIWRRPTPRRRPRRTSPVGTTRGATITRSPGAVREMPMLRLRGHWLEEAGFPIGRELAIDVREGELAIRAV